jgi:hypothetical protein
MADTSLPPLPVRKSKDIIPQQSSGGITLPDQDLDEALHSHLLRVQETIMDSADAKVSEIESKLNEAELTVKQLYENNIQTGSILYKSRKEVGMLNRNLAVA